MTEEEKLKIIEETTYQTHLMLQYMKERPGDRHKIIAVIAYFQVKMDESFEGAGVIFVQIFQKLLGYAAVEGIPIHFTVEWLFQVAKQDLLKYP